jgi:hypothetical protein
VEAALDAKTTGDKIADATDSASAAAGERVRRCETAGGFRWLNAIWHQPGFKRAEKF